MKKIILIFALAILMGGTLPYAQAQDIADQPCDAQYWRQLSSRAWLEAEREIMQNQNLIFKADSVLEYTCFDQFVSIAAWPGGNIFVHTEYFGPKIIERGTPESMEKALEAVVSDSLLKYRDGNFAHEYLGGRAGFMDIANKNSEFKPATTNQGYTCKTMADIWKAAKCMNFIDNDNFENTDGFYPYEAIKGHNGSPDVAGYEDTIQETRQYPSSMSCKAQQRSGNVKQPLGAAGTWAKQLELSDNRGQDLYQFQTPLGKIFKEVGEKTEPGKCDGQGIKTGVTVIIDNKESHEDGVCTNPGCSYAKSGKCVASGGNTGTYGDGSQNKFGVGTYNEKTGTGGF